jgi:hypothetical protein
MCKEVKASQFPDTKLVNINAPFSKSGEKCGDSAAHPSSVDNNGS